MAFDNSSSITPDIQSINQNGTVSIHFDLSFDAVPVSMTINYTIDSSCVVFKEGGGKTLSRAKSGLIKSNNSFDDPIAFSGDCPDDHFTLTVDCVITGDHLSQSIPISYEATAAATAFALHPSLEASLMKNVQRLIKKGIDAHVSEHHGKTAKKVEKKAPAKAAVKKAKQTLSNSTKK